MISTIDNASGWMEFELLLPDGHLLVARVHSMRFFVGRHLYVWDFNTGRKVSELVYTRQSVILTAFSPDNIGTS